MTTLTAISGNTRRAALPSLLLAIAMALGGCEAASPPSDTASPAPEKSVAAPAAATSNAPAPSPPSDTYWVGRFDAISNTATSVTGDLQFTPDGADAQSAIMFERAGRYITRVHAKALGLDAYSTAESATWSELLNAPMDGIVEIRKVASETLAADVPNGGLCGTVPTQWIAIVRRPESEGSDSLMIASFSAEQAPGPQSDDTALCGTYSYAPH